MNCIICNKKLHHKIKADICVECRSKIRYTCIEKDCFNKVKSENVRCRSCNATYVNRNFRSKKGSWCDKFVVKFGIEEGLQKYEEFIVKQHESKLGNKFGERKYWKYNHVGTMPHNKMTKKHLKKALLGKNKGENCSSETRKKLRFSAIKYIKESKGNCVPRYNKNAIEIIEQYGKKHGYNFQHAENGGEFHIKELGYFVDGYDPEQNVVIEYYEKAHNRTKEKDFKRQREIEEYLNCEFIILKEEESKPE